MLRRFLTWLIQALIGLVFVVGFAFLAAEWFAGCGEHYVDAKGQTHINRCLWQRDSQQVSKP
jgi:hypothetical protein